jgi:hypothetical protein
MSRSRHLVAILALLCLVVVGCGKDDPATVPGSKGHTNGSVSTTTTAPTSGTGTPDVMGRSTGG